jgi:hypothetical protein
MRQIIHNPLAQSSDSTTSEEPFESQQAEFSEKGQHLAALRRWHSLELVAFLALVIFISLCLLIESRYELQKVRADFEDLQRRAFEFRINADEDTNASSDSTDAQGFYPDCE